MTIGRLEDVYDNHPDGRICADYDDDYGEGDDDDHHNYDDDYDDDDVDDDDDDHGIHPK